MITYSYLAMGLTIYESMQRTYPTNFLRCSYSLQAQLEGGIAFDLPYRPHNLAK